MRWNYCACTLLTCSCMATPIPPGFVGHMVHLQTESHLLSPSNVCSTPLSCWASVTDLCMLSNALPKQVSLQQLGDVPNSHNWAPARQEAENAQQWIAKHITLLRPILTPQICNNTSTMTTACHAGQKCLLSLCFVASFISAALYAGWSFWKCCCFASFARARNSLTRW